MTALAFSRLFQTTLRLLAKLAGYLSNFVAGIHEARAMALLYQDLSALSDAELANRGLEREDIPRAVLGISSRARCVCIPSEAHNFRKKQGPTQSEPPSSVHALQAGTALL